MAYLLRVKSLWEEAMAGEVERSAAYRALGFSGAKVLKVIEQEVRRGVSAVSLDTLAGETGLCRSSARRGVRLAEVLGFLTVIMGVRHNSLYQLSDGWRSVGEDEAARRVKLARLPTPPRERIAPPKPATQAKVRVEVEQPQRYTPSLPQVQWLGR